MAAVTFSWGVTLAVKKEVTGDNEETAEERRKRWGICIRQVAIQLENTNKKYEKTLWTIITTVPVIIQTWSSAHFLRYQIV